MASRPIDEKIVKLGVDDADFKSKLIDSLKNLTSFGNALKTIDGGNLNSVTSAASASAKSIDEIGNSAETSKSKFSILAGAAAVALGSIASNAIATGLHLVKALTLDPIKQGFQQYQDKMQSMMALQVALGEGAKGAINGAVNSLTTYANKTVYSVNDMTGALSTLVNQGIGLNDAVTVIKGFGNAAAVAGVDTNTFKSQLDTALTQAYALGHMDYPNFKQLEMSHIVTKQFKDAMLDAAKAQGINVDLSKGFNASLASGWANVNVMNAAMKTLAENPAMLNAAQQFHSLSQATDATRESIVTGWAGVWEILIGDVNASTKLWTSLGGAVSDVITNIFKGIESLATQFVKLGGMSKLVDLLVFTVSSLYKPIAAIGKAFLEAFPSSGLAAGKVAVTIINLLSDALHIILVPLQLIGPAFQIFFGVLNIGFNIIKLILTPLTTLFSLFTKGTDLENTVNKFTDWSKVLGVVSKALSNFFGAIRSGFAMADKVVANGTTNFVNAIINTVKHVVDLVKQFTDFTKVLQGLTSPFVLVARAANVGTEAITPFMAIISLGKAVIDVFRASLKYLGDTLNNIGAGFKTFFGQLTFAFAPLSKLKDHFKEVSPEFSKMSDGLGTVGKAMQSFVKFVINLISHLNDMSKYLSTSGGAFKNFSVDMTSAGQHVRDFITNMVDAFSGSKVVTAARQLGKDIIDGLTIGIKNKSLDLFAFIKPALDGFIKSVKELFDIHSPSRVMQEIGKNIIDGLTLGLSQAADNLPNFFATIGAILKGLGEIVVKAFQAIPGAIKFVIDAFGNLVKMIAPYSQALGQIFSAIGQMISGFLNNLNTPAALKGGIIVALVGWINALNKADGPGVISKILHPLQTLKDILKEKFGDGGGILDQLKGTLKSYQNELRAKSLMEIAAAVGILAASMWVLSNIPGARLATASAGMVVAAGSLAVLYKAMESMSKDSTTIDTVTLTASIVGISAALAIMAGAVTKLSGLDVNGATIAIGAMGGIILELSFLFQYGLPQDPEKDMVKVSSLIVVALAMRTLGNTISKLAELDWNQLGVGVAGLGAAVGAITIVVNMMKLEKEESVIGFTGMAMALNLAVLPIIALGLLPWPVTLKGIVGMGLALAAMAGVNILLNKFGGNKGALGLMAMAVATNMAMVPVIALGLLPWPMLIQGILGMASALGELLVANMLMTKFGGGAGSAGFMAMAAAMNMLVPTIIILGALPWQVVVAGLLAMAAALAIFVGAGALSEMVLPGMLALAAVLSSFSLASASFGLAITAIATAIAIVATVVVTEGEQFVKALGGMLKAVGNLGPVLGTAIGTLIGGLISGLASAIANNFGSLVQSATQIVEALVQGLLGASGTLINGIVTLLNQLLDAILSEIPIIAIKLGNGILDLMNTLALFIQNNTATILNAISNVIVAVITLITTALGKMLGKIPYVGNDLKNAVMDAGKSATDGLSDTFPPGMQAATTKGAEEGIKGLASKSQAMREQALQLAMNAKDGASQISTFMNLLGVQGGDEFVNGVKSGAIPAQQAGDLLKQMAKAGASNGSLEEMAKAMGGTYANGVFTPETAQKTADAAKKLPQTAADNAKPTDGQKTGVQAALAGLAGSGIAGVQSKTGDAGKAGSDINNAINSALGKTSDHSGAGASTAASKVAGINSQRGAASGAADGINNTVSNTLSRTSNHSGAGAYSAGTKVDGVNSQKGRMSGAVNSLNSATDELGKHKDFSSSGRSIGDSFANGISSARDSVGRAASGLMNWAKSFFPHSPAPRGPFSGAGWTFIRTSGKTIVKSFAEGISGSINQVTPATTTLMQTVHDAINSVNEDLSNNGVFTPTITPVVDMKNIDNLDLSNFDSLGTISGGNFLSKVQYENMNQNQQQISQTNSLVSELQSGFTTLRESLDTLNNLNDGQLQVLQNQPSPDIYVDGTVMTDTLAPKMTKAQNDYNNRMAYIGGIQQNL